MSRPRPLWLFYTSPQTVEYAHELQVKSGLDVRLLLHVQNPPASALTSDDQKTATFNPTTADLALLNLLAVGSAPKEIAGTLRITIRGVRLRLLTLREKLGVKSNEQMIAQAVRLGLVK